ncbi:hypothetical protein ACFC18_48620 [Streptomyces sp. NPDC056121]|uniref:hypothetical protein n=1 Tax=Streptomyces sp. NPDC056121 TaxID=3345718 RepID=UPI0035E0DF25
MPLTEKAAHGSELHRRRTSGLAASQANDDQSDAVAGLAGDSQPGRQRIRRRGAEASRTSPGSGLGLAFVAAVAASHGGTAHAQNTGQGAAVTVKIPC